MEKIILLANNLYKSQPFQRGFEINSENELNELSSDEKIDFLVYCFKKYDKFFNQSLILHCKSLWKNFNREDWNILITKMFPREEFDRHSFKDINSGNYFDVLLLNGIINIDPFQYIFNNPEITFEEKKLFYEFLKHRGEYYFYINERELIENIVNYYNLDIFQEIVTMKEKLIQEGLTPAFKYEEVIEKYLLFDIQR